MPDAADYETEGELGADRGGAVEGTVPGREDGDGGEVARLVDLKLHRRVPLERDPVRPGGRAAAVAGVEEEEESAGFCVVALGSNLNSVLVGGGPHRRGEVF